MSKTDDIQDGDVRIGAFRLYRTRGELRQNGRRVSLSPKAIQVLDCMLAARPEPVSQATFIAEVWDDNYVVGEHGLRDAVWELRKAFRDDPRQPRFIRTIPRKGYCLLPTVQAAGGWKQRFNLPTLVAVGASLGLALAVLMIQLEPHPAIPEAPRWTDAAPVISGDLQRAAVIREVDQQNDLFIIEGQFDGFGNHMRDSGESESTNVMQITTSSETEISPVWAPNHRDLAFIEYDAETGECRLRVYFSIDHRVASLVDDCYVVISPIGAVPGQLAWSNDGLEIAYQARSGPRSATIASVPVNRDGSSYRLTAPRDGVDAFPRWSREGQLAYLQLADPMMAAGEVVVLGSDGEGSRICPAFPVWALTWIDDRYVAVAGAMHNPFAIWLVDTTNGSLIKTGRYARHLQSVPVGNTLLVDYFSMVSPLQQSSLDDQSPPLTIELDGWPLYADYSEVNDQYAIVESSAEDQQLVLLDRHGNKKSIRTATEIYRPRFSSDGKHLGFTSRASVAENVKAWSLDLETGHIRQLSSGDSPVFFGEWAANGQSYFGLKGIPAPLGSGASLFRFNLQGEPLEHIADGAGLKVVNDSSGVLWWSDDSGAIYEQGKRNTSPRVIATLKSVYESWMVDRSTGTLYFTESEFSRTRIHAFSTAGQGHDSVVKTFSSQIDPLVGLTLGRDRSLLFRRSSWQWLHRDSIALEDLSLQATQTDFRWQACQQSPKPELLVAD